MRLTRGMTENFNEKCDLIVSHLRAPLNPRMRGTPMLLVGPVLHMAAMQLRSGARLTEANVLLKWGSKGEMRVWVVNAPLFDLPEEAAKVQTPEDLFGEVPVVLAEMLLNAYPGPKAVVADPSMGAGAVGAAARSLGLYFIGVEPYVERFAAAQAKLLA